ncbi:unnamed protein product [Sphagnum jensenii]|uniref:Uncharacterized protein n=1 Tax=Sphagnum jensenii TaxID=128206 RepID=A0ABP0X5T3_9BRYO
MGSPRLCGCSIFLVVVVVVQLSAAGVVGPSFATAAAAWSTPRRYGPLAEGNMAAEGSTMIMERGRGLLQLATNEDNVPRVTAEARTYVLEEQIQKENATLDLNPNATEKELKTQELELMQKAAEEKKGVSRSEPEGTVEKEEEESVLVKKKKVGNETELMASTEEKGLSKAGSEDAVEEEESASSVKTTVGSKTELTMAANNQTLSKSAAQEEEDQEQSVSVKRKVGDDQQAAAAEETVVSKTDAHKAAEEEEEEEELVPAKKKTVGKETDDLEEKELTKSAHEEGEEGSVPAKKNAFTKSAAEEEAVEEGEEESVPAKKKAFTKSAAEEEAVEEGEEESVPAKKKAFTKSAAEEEGVEEGEEESVPAKKAFTKSAAEEEAVEEGEEELVPAKKKALTKSEAQEEAVEEEEEELSPMKKKVKEAKKAAAAAEESPESESEEEEEEEEESLPAKEKVRKEANLKAVDQEKESLKSEAQEAVEEEEEEPIPAKKIIGKAATANKKELSTKSDSEEEVEEDDKESIPIKKKKVENSTELNAAADKKKTSKSEAQEAVEEEEEESIFARKKLGNKTELKAAEKKEMMNSEAEAEEESNSIPVKKKMGIETELQKAAADKKKLSKSEAQVAVEEKDEEQPKDLAAGSKGQKTDVLNKSVKVNGQNGAAKSADAEQQKKEVSDEGEAESQEGMNIDNSQDLEVDLDQNDIDLLQEVQDLPTNIQQTVGALTTHLFPKIQQFSGQSKTSFDQINKNLASSFLPLIGEKYAPIIATMVSYCLLLLPVAVVLFLCERIRAILTLQKVLLFINIYLAAYFAILFTITLGLRAEPISFFYRNSPSSYIVLQLLQAFGYIIYILLQTADVVFTCSRGTLFGKSSAVIQWLVATLVGLHYYFTVFHRAMARKPLITNWKFYGFYCLSFLVCCLLARIQHSKKEYVPLGDETTDKKN